jgi:uncharacterized membrane protein
MLAASMASGFARALTVSCALGAGLVAGVYFAFSTFVMRGLREVPPATGMAAMQSINKAAPNPLFVFALVGTGLGCVVLGVVAATRWRDPAAPWALAGAALYVVSLGLTIAYHIPRNDALERVDPTSAGASARWSRYLAEWVPWNHVRTLAALAGAVAMTIALAREA